MKRILLAGMLAATALSAYAADKDKAPKKPDCASCCDAECKGKDCPPEDKCKEKTCPPAAPKK